MRRPGSAPTSCSPTRARCPGGHRLLDADAARVSELAARAAEAGVEILAGAAALGSFDGLVPVWQGDILHQVRAAQLVFATGTIEQPLVFAGNDLPGVMLASGARRLASLYAVSPGQRAVVATTSDRGLRAARALRERGVQIVAIADLRPAAERAGARAGGRGGPRPARAHGA